MMSAWLENVLAARHKRLSVRFLIAIIYSRCPCFSTTTARILTRAIAIIRQSAAAKAQDVHQHQQSFAERDREVNGGQQCQQQAQAGG
jgi:hypothetical protein